MVQTLKKCPMAVIRCNIAPRQNTWPWCIWWQLKWNLQPALGAKNSIFYPIDGVKKWTRIRSGNFRNRHCNIIIYYHIYIYIYTYMIDFFCNFGVFRVKIWQSLFYTNFCIRLLQYYTPNFESFWAKLKVWKHFLLSHPKITFFDSMI